MTVTAVIVIILAIAMMVGPIFLLQPTGRQRQDAKLRALAGSKGMKVRMDKVGNEIVAAYRLPWPTDPENTRTFVVVKLIRSPYEHGIHLARFWAKETQKPLNDTMTAILENALPKLPDSVLGLEINCLGIEVYWQELGGEATLEALYDWLGAVSQSVLEK